MKYTIDDRGLDWFQSELERRLGWSLQAARPFQFETNCDRTGWTSGTDGSWHYTLFIENGRVQDAGNLRLMSALREIARVHAGDFRLTPNQNLIIANIAADERTRIQSILEEYGLDERPRTERAPAERHGLRCASDVRAGHGRERTLSAQPAHQD